MGGYHGKYTFDTFSHMKSVLARDFSCVGEYLGETRYPPYQPWKIRRMTLLLKNRKIPACFSKLSYILFFVLGLATPMAVEYLWPFMEVLSKKTKDWF
jgi:hypothetical protein